VALTGCSTIVSGEAAPDSNAIGVSPAPSDSPTPESSVSSSTDTEEALPPGAAPGLDDLNGDGTPEPTCGTHDYGAGLVLRLLCNTADYAYTPTEDTVLSPNSLFAQPNLELDLTGISGNAAQARDLEGRKRAVLFITSDTLFATGSAELSEPARANFDAIARLITTQWPGAPVEIRGHTDSVGDPATNQRLSEQRAAAAADYLSGHGIDRSQLTSAGLGSSVPLVLETNQDGSPNLTGRVYNRRVEIVITVE
jgi:outer membrane protein OmpA-like peptidoglycan-associated protein